MPPRRAALALSLGKNANVVIELVKAGFAPNRRSLRKTYLFTQESLVRRTTMSAGYG